MATAGSGYGIAKSGVGVAAVGIVRPKIFVKTLVPVVMAGMGGIYGLIASVVIVSSSTCIKFHLSLAVKVDQYSEFRGMAHLAAGLAVGLTSLPVGFCTGILGDQGVRDTAKNEKVFVGMVLMLVFAGACALYGLIVALLISIAQ
jgi:V-type H+-transporting ATPase proteolipid subunit